MASLNTPMKTHTEHTDMPSQPICPDKEGFQHNHQECMKEQDRADNLHSHQHTLFLTQMRGDTDPSKKLPSPRTPSRREPEPESPKILEEIRGDPYPSAPPPCRTPKSPNGYAGSPTNWDASDSADSPKNWPVYDFKMKNTP